MIVIVFGLPGSGKSYFAARLAELIKAEHLNSDLLRKEMFQHRTYSASEKELVYLKMLEKMQIAIDQKRDIIIDATFHTDKRRRLFTNKIPSGEYTFIEVWADENITKERVNKSRPDSEADFEVYKLIKNIWEPLKEPHLILESTNNNIDEMLNLAIQHLKLKDDTRAN